MGNNNYYKQLMIDAIKPHLYSICDSQIDEEDYHFLDLRLIAELLVEPIFQMMMAITGSVVANMITPYVVQFVKNIKFIRETQQINISQDKAKLLMIAAIESYKENQSSNLLKLVEDVYDMSMKIGDVNHGD